MLDNKNDCTGCGACDNVCPVNALKMIPDYEGFLHPIIDDQKCIHCQKCQQTCPVINQMTNSSFAKYFAARTKIDEKESTSGGIFAVIAKYVLSQGGIVFGSAFDENYKIIHRYIENVEDLQHLQGTKYVQSNIGHAFRQAKKHLDEKKLVLFSGVPCQIAGLKKYLSMSYDNLICIDLICHGVPSPGIWEMYLKTFYKNKRITKICFRDKNYTNKKVFSIQYNNSKKYIRHYPLDPYIWGFSYDLFLRKSCFDCKFKDMNYYSDITIGDAWGIKNYSETLYDSKKRTSVMILRSKKGEDIFKQISNCIDYEKVDAIKVIDNNKRIIKSVNYNKDRDKFFQELNRHSFRYVLLKFYYKGLFSKMFEHIKK